MNRRAFFRAVVAAPLAAAVSPLLPKLAVQRVVIPTRNLYARVTITPAVMFQCGRRAGKSAFAAAMAAEMDALIRDIARREQAEWLHEGRR